MSGISRKVALQNLKQHLGKDLYLLAKDYGISTYETGKQNKGWKGLVLERLAGLETNVSKAPDGGDFELKSVSFYEIDRELVPRETMAIAMFTPEELMSQDFFESCCWEKLRGIIFCAVRWNGYQSKKSELLKVSSLDFHESERITQQIKMDYDFIRNKLLQLGSEMLNGKDGQWIQVRPKGAGHGSTGRAFYARKELVKYIFDTAR